MKTKHDLLAIVVFLLGTNWMSPVVDAFVFKKSNHHPSISALNGMQLEESLYSTAAVDKEYQKEEAAEINEESSVARQNDNTENQKKLPVDHQNSASDRSRMLSEISSSKSNSTFASFNASTKRALRLLDIVFQEMINPVVRALMKDGIPQDWDLFWDSPAYIMEQDEDNENDNDTASVPTVHDDGSILNMSLATRVTLALEEMGPTYVKFGQALSSRPDIVPRSLAKALTNLQDQMQPFDTEIAKTLIRSELLSSSLGANNNNNTIDEAYINEFVSTLSKVPVAAASIGQVYSGILPRSGNSTTGQKVAIKVQRPGIRNMVNEDATLLRTIVGIIESIPAIPGLQKNQDRLVSTDLSGAVEEFMSRIMEELDYRNEAKNIETFSNLYSHRRHLKNETETARNDRDSSIQVVVPEVYMDYCTENVLVMEWMEGVKLVDLGSQQASRESLALIQQGIDCTLSQLLDTGVLHADPHGGNLLKVLETTTDENGDELTIQRLGYVDFGLLSTIPESVRDGLVCAVAELIFSRNIQAVASLFGELDLIPQEILDDPMERAALSAALNDALSSVLQYDAVIRKDDGNESDGTSTTTIPSLRFDKLLDALSRLVPRFRFQLPPYFLNNARALGTLEGMAREIDPDFNVLQVLYPYALERLLSNPRNSPVVEATLQNLIRNPITGRVDKNRVKKLIDDSALLTGYSRSKVLRDILASKSGPRLAMIVVGEQVRRVVNLKAFDKLANAFRL